MYEYLVYSDSRHYKRGDIIVSNKPLSYDLVKYYKATLNYDTDVIEDIINTLEHDVLDQYSILYRLKTAYLIEHDIEDYVIATSVLVGYVCKRVNLYPTTSYVNLTKENVDRISKQVQDIIDSLQSRIKNLVSKLKDIK